MIWVAHVTLYFIDGYAAIPFSDFHNGLILIYYKTYPPLLSNIEHNVRGQGTAGVVDPAPLLLPQDLLPHLHLSTPFVGRWKNVQ